MDLPPSAYATLAAQLKDPDLQRAFADLTLTGLLESYDEILQRSAKSQPDTAEERAKLARWQHGTNGIMARLEELRLELEAGAPLALDVERRRQVLMVINNEVVAVSDPRVDGGGAFESQVVARFCGLYDCDGLGLEAPLPEASKATVEGTWSFSQGLRPSYRVDDRYRFDFEQLGDRAAKEALCRQAVEELDRLAGALRQTRDQGRAIDWGWMAERPPAPGVDQRVELNRAGDYLPLHLPLLTRLSTDDWQRVVAWLQAGPEAPLLRLEQAEALGPSAGK